MLAVPFEEQVAGLAITVGKSGKVIAETTKSVKGGEAQPPTVLIT